VSTVVGLALGCFPLYVVAALLLAVGFGRMAALYRHCGYEGEPEDQWQRDGMDG
jgi:hypothetical protein